MTGFVILIPIFFQLSYSKVKFLLIQYDIFNQKEMSDCQIKQFVCIKTNWKLIKRMRSDGESDSLYDSLIKMLYLQAVIFRQKW